MYVGFFFFGWACFSLSLGYPILHIIGASLAAWEKCWGMTTFFSLLAILAGMRDGVEGIKSHLTTLHSHHMREEKEIREDFIQRLQHTLHKGAQGIKAAVDRLQKLA